jgi:hypothetical protein
MNKTYIAIPAKTRHWPFYPIVMPLDVDNMGPCKMSEVTELTWEVWDDMHISHGSFKNLYDAIDHAMALTVKYPDHRPNGTVRAL